MTTSITPAYSLQNVTDVGATTTREVSLNNIQITNTDANTCEIRSINSKHLAFKGSDLLIFRDSSNNTVGRFRYSLGACFCIGGTNDTKAALEVISTSKVALLPRMTSAQKNAISSPPNGSIVYDTDLNKLCVYTGSAWETITSA
jgi:hypothetical protein